MDYKKEFQEFIQSMEAGQPVPSEAVGKLIVKMASYFSQAVSLAVKAEYAFNKKLAEFEGKVDENGKSLSSTKATSQAQATPEYLDYISAKGDVVSLEQYINALKSLQKSLANEFSYSSV
jgi:hypothetical protein